MTRSENVQAAKQVSVANVHPKRGIVDGLGTQRAGDDNSGGQIIQDRHVIMT
jgi:hypothetical protein